MKKGSWVVCVDDSSWDPEAYTHLSSLPVKNRLYRVRKLFSINGAPGVAVDGIFGKHLYWTDSKGTTRFSECHFYGWRFREVQLPGIAGFDDEAVKKEPGKNTSVKKKRKTLKPVTESIS